MRKRVLKDLLPNYFFRYQFLVQKYSVSCHSPVATSLQYLRKEFLYHNSYVMPELAAITQTFCVVLEFLQFDFWNTVILLQDWSYHCRSFMDVIMNSWIVMVYLSAPWKLICSTCHSLPFLFCLPWNILFIRNSAGVPRKAEVAYPIGADGPCSKF